MTDPNQSATEPSEGKTPIYPTPCLICGRPVEDYVAEYCCGGRDCGCLGLPIEPCLCSKECSAALFGKDGTMEERRIKAGIAIAPTYATLERENQSLQQEVERLRDECEWLVKQYAALRKTAEAARVALRELYAMVKGECPSLLNEDSGGDGALDLQIEEALAELRARLDETK